MSAARILGRWCGNERTYTRDTTSGLTQNQLSVVQERDGAVGGGAAASVQFAGDRAVHHCVSDADPDATYPG